MYKYIFGGKISYTDQQTNQNKPNSLSIKLIYTIVY